MLTVLCCPVTVPARAEGGVTPAQDEAPPKEKAASAESSAAEKNDRKVVAAAKRLQSRKAITYTPAKLPQEGLGEFPGFEDKAIRLPLSLTDAVRIAIRNNLDIEIEVYNRQIARRRIIIERALFDPIFNLAFTYGDNREPTVSPLDFDPLEPILGVEVNPFDVTTIQSGLRGTTLLGTSYQVSVSESRFDSPEASLFSLNPRYSTRGEVTVTQPLLRGGWYNTNSANIRIARNNLRVSQSQFRLTAINTIFNVVSAYWDLVFTNEDYKSKANALGLAIDQLRIDRQRERAGAIARVDLITPESQLAQRKTDFDAAITRFENARDQILFLMNYTGKNSLKRLWKLKDEKSPFENILVLPTDKSKPELVVYDRNESLNKAFALREEYRQIESQMKSQEIVVEVARNRLLPGLDLSATWTQLGLGEDFQESLQSTDSGRYHDWLVGVTLELPLTYRGPLNDLRNARDENRKLMVQQHNLENAIVLEVDQSIREIRESYRTVQNLRHEVELQGALLQAEKARLAVGRSIAYNVSQIENDFVEIQTQAIRAETNFEKFKAAYQRAVGTLLESYGIVTTNERKDQ